MASTQASLKAPFKDLTSFKGNVKRLYRERLEDAPIKKRVMAEINLKRRNLEGLPRSPKVKRERLEDQPGETDLGSDEGEKLFHAAGGSSAKALDLSPGLKHTLAQFTLSSQISLGGPAAFSARKGHDPASPGMPAPLPSPAVLGGGPLLVPCDSSTELTHSALEGESISCFVVGGEKRLCLPQVLNSVLRDFSLQQINAVCDELYVYCSRCDAEQLHVLKVLGVLPFNAPSCGLITLTDAQRLCNALLRPGATLPRGGGLATAVGGLLKESEANFQVEHQCLGKGQGLFVPHFYTQPDAPCIQCVECQLLFAPERFVMHSHRSPDKRTCHWGFDSAKWARYLQLGRKHLGTPEEARLKLLLEEMKEKFNCPLKRRLDKAHYDDDQVRSATSSLCSPGDKLSESDPGRKDQSLTTLVFNRLYADIKEEPIHTALLHPSCYLYTYDKGVPPNVSLPHSLRKDDESSPDMLGALLKRHYSEACRAALSLDKDVRTPPITEIHTTISAATEAVKPKHGGQRGAVAMENAGSPPTPATDTGVEDDKDRIVVEIVQMYSRQQEKLNSTLKKQLQLEMELEALRGGEAARLRELSAEQGELQSELEAMHSEHAQRLGAVQLEQQQLEQRLEQLRQQGCACEAHYTAQLSELRQRLDRAEADREELQEELQREREAREKLEHTISQLRRQMGEAPLPTPPENAEVNLGPS